MNDNNPAVVLCSVAFAAFFIFLAGFFFGFDRVTENLSKGKTISMDNCYAQYSAVRRFKK